MARRFFAPPLHPTSGDPATRVYGSGSVPVAGLQRDRLRFTVSYDAAPDRVQAASHSFNVRIPTVSGKPAFKSRGILYYGASLAE
jgi:hypothetical protein